MYAVNANARPALARQEAHEREPHLCPHFGCRSWFYRLANLRIHMMRIHGQIDAPVNANAQLNAQRNIQSIANAVSQLSLETHEQRDLENGMDQS